MQDWMEKEAEEKMAKGGRVRIGYQKTNVNEDWLHWSEEDRRLGSRRFAAETRSVRDFRYGCIVEYRRYKEDYMCMGFIIRLHYNYIVILVYGRLGSNGEAKGIFNQLSENVYSKQKKRFSQG